MSRLMRGAISCLERGGWPATTDGPIVSVDLHPIASGGKIGSVGSAESGRLITLRAKFESQAFGSAGEPGLVLRVPDLDTLIAVKEERGLPKDTAVLPARRQALKEWSERQR
jgi:hypothetical protein